MEADQVKDQEELPGKDLKEILNLSQPEGRGPTPLPLSRLAPIPSKDVLFGDVKQKLNELGDTRVSLQKRKEEMREKYEAALQVCKVKNFIYNLCFKEKIRLRQQNNRRSHGQRKKLASVSLPGMLDEEAEAKPDESKTVEEEQKADAA